jgi:hypothetical protein
MSFDNMLFDNMSFNNMLFDNMLFDKMSFDNMLLYNMLFDNMSFDISMTVVHSNMDKITFYRRSKSTEEIHFSSRPPMWRHVHFLFFDI